jgi:hypothetical protein
MERPKKSDYQYDHREIVTKGGHTTYASESTKRWLGNHKVHEYLNELEKYADHLEALVKGGIVGQSEQLKTFLDYCDEAGWIKNIDKQRIFKDYIENSRKRA